MDIQLNPLFVFLILFLVPVAMMFKSAFALRKLQSPQPAAKIGMSEITITFRNDNDEPIYLQVDIWAGLYLLKKGEQIEIVAASEKTSPSFDVTESGTTRILTLWDSEEYYIVIEGKRIHYLKYLTDPRLCKKCLKMPNSKGAVGDICKCG